MSIRGVEALQRALDEIIERIEDLSYITQDLEGTMRDVVHIDTGYLQSTIYSNDEIAGASARYAGFEEERGGDHSYATIAIDRFDVDDYVDYLVEPF